MEYYRIKKTDGGRFTIDDEDIFDDLFELIEVSTNCKIIIRAELVQQYLWEFEIVMLCE